MGIKHHVASGQAGAKPIVRRLRVNERIRAPEIRLIDEDGNQLGVMPLAEALEIARERDADLVEVAPNATPPVCRLLDYGRFRYEQAKREREARKHQKSVEVKEIRLRPKVGEHDIDFKVRRAQKLLNEGDKVKLSVFFRGREVTHPEIALQLLERVRNSLEGDIIIEKPAAMEGRAMTTILALASPRSAKGRRAPKGEDPETPAQ